MMTAVRRFLILVGAVALTAVALGAVQQPPPVTARLSLTE